MANIELSKLTNKEGVTIKGAHPGDYSSSCARLAGDINNDGYDDLIIGAQNANNGDGESYIIYGGSSYTEIDLLTLRSNGVTINGAPKGSLSGYSVNAAGDVNRDGYDDVLIGAPYVEQNSTGMVYLLYGGKNLPSVINLSDIDNFGVSIFGVSINDSAGISVSKAGDVNADGYDDIIIGANGEENCSGRAYVIYGGKALPLEIHLANLTKSQGFIILGAEEFSYLGHAVATARKFNNDIYDDLIIGAWGVNSKAGVSYVIYGDSDMPLIIDVSNLGKQGALIYGAPRNSLSSWSVSSAGDVNNDSYDDIIIGAPNANLYSGIVYLIFGTNYKYTEIDLSSPDFIEYDGIKIYGEINSDLGASISAAGDINKDGYDDIIIGAPFSNSNAGISYVIYGSSILSSITIVSFIDETGFYIVGESPQWYSGGSVSSAGDFNNDGYPDVIVGAPNANEVAGKGYIVYGADSGFITQSPTQSPKPEDFFDLLNKYKDFISGGASAATFIIGWLFRSKIAYYIIDNWGFEYVFLKNIEAEPLVKGKIGICLIDMNSEQLFFKINHNYIKAEVNLGNNNGLSSGLYNAIVISLKENSESFTLLNSEKNQIRDFLLSNDYINFNDLGICRGLIYKFCLSNFRHLHADKHKLAIRKSSNSPLHFEEFIKNLKINENNIEMQRSEKETRPNNKILMSIDAMTDSKHVELQNKEFIRFADHLTYFINEQTTTFVLSKLPIKHSDNEVNMLSIDQKFLPSNIQSDSYDDSILSLLNTKQILYNLPLLHYITQKAMESVGYNITLPDPSDNKAMLVSLDLLLGNAAAQYLPSESIMNGMLISTASSISFAARLTADDYLKNQEVSDDPIELIQQCGLTIAAHSLPSILNYAFAKAFLPAPEMSALDILGTSSFGVAQCYNNYKAAYDIAGESSALNTVVPYIADALTLWTLKDHMTFDTSGVGSLTVSVKNAISIAATTYAAHCVSDVAMDFIPQGVHDYIDTAFYYVTETVNDLIDNLYDNLVDVIIV